MTITLNFTSIFAWIGGLVCLVVSLWALTWIVTWIVIYIRAAGEFLGIWYSLGRVIRGSTSWVWSKLVRRSNNSGSSEGKHSSGT